MDIQFPENVDAFVGIGAEAVLNLRYPEGQHIYLKCHAIIV